MLPQQYVPKVCNSFHYRIGQTFSLFLYLFDEIHDDLKWFKFQKDGEIDIKKVEDIFHMIFIKMILSYFWGILHRIHFLYL